MRERLIELLQDSPHLNVMYDSYDEWNDAAGYLLAHGVIVLPCKVGDTVYYLSGKYEKQGRKNVYVKFVDEAIVDNIVIGQKGVPQIDVCNAENEWTLFDGEDDFGKSVFLTREEAEQALKERYSNGE